MKDEGKTEFSPHEENKGLELCKNMEEEGKGEKGEERRVTQQFGSVLKSAQLD